MTANAQPWNTSAPSQLVGRVSSSTDLASGTTKPSLSAAMRPAIHVNEFVSTECSLALFLQAFCNASDSFFKGVTDRFSKNSSELVLYPLLAVSENRPGSSKIPGKFLKQMDHFRILAARNPVLILQ